VSYVRSHNGLGLTGEQGETLAASLSDKDLLSLPIGERADLALRHQEAEASESQAKWHAISTFVIVAVPLLALFGLATSEKR
jgi:hypothetical protein